MSAMIVCASHSPLMFTRVGESQPGAHRTFFDAIDAVAERVRAFAPDLVVLFSPDHFNALYYDLMPAFCVVAEGYSSSDWHQPAGELRIARELAIDAVRSLHAMGFDPALSMRMRVDHGMTIALTQITGGYTSYPLLPVYVNCAADPRPSMRRAREFGAAIGRIVGERAARVLFIGSGGLSHDPPTPRLASATPEGRERILVRHAASAEVFLAREERVIAIAERLAAGEPVILPPDERWDRGFMERIAAGDLAALDALSDAAIDRDAGFGGHEIRCWVAACAAGAVLGSAPPRLDYYRIIPEWITGMAIMTSAPAQAR